MIPAPETMVLRPTAEPDLNFVMRAERETENRRFVGQWGRERHREVIAGADAAHMILERAEDERPVGFAILRGLQGPDRCIEVKRLAVTEKGQGYGRAALRRIKALAFEELGMHRLWLDVMESNDRARALYESEGFVFEGVMREHLKVGDGYESLVIMSILEGEYGA